MSFLDVPVITQEQYEKLYDESDVIKYGRDLCGFRYINRILDKFLNQYRKCAWFNKYDKYNRYESLRYNEVYDAIILGSFNMNYFIKDKKEKPFYLKVNFSFPKTNIESFKENLKKDYVNTFEFIPVIVNPKLFSDRYYQYFPNKEERALSTAHVRKTSEEDNYDNIKYINNFFEKTTGEVLFFRF